MSTTETTRQNETFDEWIAARRIGVGASQAAIVLGRSKFMTPLELYLRKTHQVADDFNASDVQQWGNFLQPGIAQAYMAKTGRGLIDHSRRVHRHEEWPWMLASLDYEAKDRVVEIKKCVHWMREDFGEPGTLNFPEQYYLQLQQQMACTGHARGDLAVLIGDTDFRIYEVERNDALIGWLATIERDFMLSVWNLEPPLPDIDHVTTTDLLNHIRPEPKKEIILGDEVQTLLDDLDKAAKAESVAKRHRQRLKGQLLALMGDAAIAKVADGRSIVRREVNKKESTVAASSYVSFNVKAAPKPKKEKTE